MKAIEKMHQLFGVSEQHSCKDCEHLGAHIANRKWYKCEVYGFSCSEASDWRLKWQACGMFNKPYTGREVHLLRIKPDAPEEQLEGQVSLL